MEQAIRVRGPMSFVGRYIGPPSDDYEEGQIYEIQALHFHREERIMLYKDLGHRVSKEKSGYMVLDNQDKIVTLFSKLTPEEKQSYIKEKNEKRIATV